MSRSQTHKGTKQECHLEDRKMFTEFETEKSPQQLLGDQKGDVIVETAQHRLFLKECVHR